jgi:hypothetical protein
MRARLQPTTGFAQKHDSALRPPVQPAERASDPRSAGSGFHDSKGRHSASEACLLFESVVDRTVPGRRKGPGRAETRGPRTSPLISRALSLPGIPVNQLVTDK